MLVHEPSSGADTLVSSTPAADGSRAEIETLGDSVVLAGTVFAVGLRVLHPAAPRLPTACVEAPLTFKKLLSGRATALCYFYLRKLRQVSARNFRKHLALV